MRKIKNNETLELLDLVAVNIHIDYIWDQTLFHSRKDMGKFVSPFLAVEIYFHRKYFIINESKQLDVLNWCLDADYTGI